MAEFFDSSVASELLAGMRKARGSIGRGELVVLPTDTVYGVAADAFNPRAVQRLLDAKGRGRSAPPPVLIPGIPTLNALAETVPEAVQLLVREFWPGGLTVIVTARSSLAWDLGETAGTVALRMPNHPLALELLSETGPLAVSSANRTGVAPGVNAFDAQQQLGDAVAVYLEAGPSSDQLLPSTIVDAVSGDRIRIVRDGAITREQIAAIIGDLLEEASP